MGIYCNDQQIQSGRKDSPVLNTLSLDQRIGLYMRGTPANTFLLWRKTGKKVGKTDLSVRKYTIQTQFTYLENFFTPLFHGEKNTYRKKFRPDYFMILDFDYFGRHTKTSLFPMCSWASYDCNTQFSPFCSHKLLWLNLQAYCLFLGCCKKYSKIQVV